MLSIGEITDKLVIELIKAHTIREKLHSDNSLTVGEYNDLNEKLMLTNTNRGILKKELDNRIESVQNGKPNRILKHIRTY